jgi:hydrogenase maturation protease
MDGLAGNRSATEMCNRVLLVGVGNEFRTDDGLGIFIAREVKRRAIADVEVVEHGGEGTSLIETWRGAQVVFIVDAVSSGSRPGMLHRFDVSGAPLPHKVRTYSCHAFGVAEALETARTLNRLPPVVLLFGIEGEQFDLGIGLTDTVVRSVPELLSQISLDIQSTLHTVEQP